MRRVFFLGLACFALLAGCGSSDEKPATGPDAQEEDPSIDDVVYQEGATDEALVSVIGVPAQKDDAKAAALTTPASGSTTSLASIDEIDWSTGTAKLRRRGHRRVRFADVARLLGAPAEAEAHGTPNTGLVYFLTFTAPDGSRVLRVFTTAPKLTLDDAIKRGLAAAPQPLTVELVTARVENNDLTGGPYEPTSPATLTLTP